MPRISLVVPVYNVEDYLDECIGSLRAQTLDDIEIICVDDGSTDGSASKLAAASKEDSRIVVLAMGNSGVSIARNVGIAEATGDIVMFVDSDDMLDAKACQTVSAAFECSGADIVTFGARCYPKELGYPKLEECLSPRDVLYESFSLDVLFKENGHPYIWRSAFSKEFFQRTGLRFCEGMSFGEDQAFHFMAYPRSNRTLFVSEKLYGYRMGRTGSAMGDRNHDAAKKVQEHIEMLDHILADWAEQGWLERYSRDMLRWSLDVVLLDLANLKDPVRSSCAEKFAALLHRRFNDARRLIARPIASKVIYALDRAGKNGFRLSKAMVLAYYLESRGLRACFARAAGAAKSRLRQGSRRL